MGTKYVHLHASFKTPAARYRANISYIRPNFWVSLILGNVYDEVEDDNEVEDHDDAADDDDDYNDDGDDDILRIIRDIISFLTIKGRILYWALNHVV